MKSKITLFLVLTITNSGCTTAAFVDSVIDGSYFDEPIIKYGEFPFSLSFLVDGQLKTIEDTLICKYDGKKVDASGAKNRWNMSFSSGRDYILLKKLDNNRYIYLPVGGCKTYMDDWPDYVKVDLEQMGPALSSENETGTTYSALSTEIAESEYGIKIVTWNYTNPISQPEKQ